MAAKKRLSRNSLSQLKTAKQRNVAASRHAASMAAAAASVAG